VIRLVVRREVKHWPLLLERRHCGCGHSRARQRWRSHGTRGRDDRCGSWSQLPRRGTSHKPSWSLRVGLIQNECEEGSLLVISYSLPWLVIRRITAESEVGACTWGLCMGCGGPVKCLRPELQPQGDDWCRLCCHV
jgi:hypothetical protein